MCSSKCGIDIHLENGKIVKVANMQEHLLNRRCAKSNGIPELLNLNDRITDPMVKHHDGWQKISWGEALDLAAGKLNQFKRESGPESLLIFIGYPWNSSHERPIMERFAHAYGTPNYTNDGSVCYRAVVIAGALTIGSPMSVDYRGSTNSNCQIIWGLNPDESWPPYRLAARSLQKRGGKLIVIDPRSIPLAKKADIFAQCRPGTDCAIALGLLNVIICNKLYDEDFVKTWTIGFDRLAEHVKTYSPEKVAAITGVPAETIREIAMTYALNKPAFISTGISLEHSIDGIHTLRAVAILAAITGNLDVPGGNKYSPKLPLKDMTLDDLTDRTKAVGSQFALFSHITHQTSYVPAIEQLITAKPYKIRSLLVAGGNPVQSWPNTQKVIAGFCKLDFKVVIDLYMTETAKLADLILPGSSFLERVDLRTYSQHYGEPSLLLTKKVIEPLGNSMEDWKIFAALAEKMGLGQYFPWKNDEDLIEDFLESTPLNLKDLEKNPAGLNYADRSYRQYLKGGFNTPSKKVEIYSETMKAFGYEPLPTPFCSEPNESNQTATSDQFPLIVFSCRKNPYTHSQYRNLPSQRKRLPEPIAEIHPDTAAAYGVGDGEVVEIESPKGSVHMKLDFSKNILPGLIATQTGWKKPANINYLTDDKIRDPISGFPTYKTMCRIKKIR